LTSDKRSVILTVMSEGEPIHFRIDQIQRYQRQMIMPEVGPIGQRKLLAAKVLMIGAGGLGSPVAVYLVSAGVGNLGIVDYDTVDMSNLHRQILHGHKDLGKLKVDSAEENLWDRNPDTKVTTYTDPISSENAFDIMRPYDVIVNGSDNFPTRYLVNDAAYLLKKPLVDGSILKFDGQAMTFIPGEGCYRCLFPEPPPPGAVPSCADAGVLGAMCGWIGSIQAVETCKIILGEGKLLSNRMLIIDGWEMETHEYLRRRNTECALCGDNPSITDLIDYDRFCGGPPTALG